MKQVTQFSTSGRNNDVAQCFQTVGRVPVVALNRQLEDGSERRS
jgi:hypothetical protein